MKEGLIVTPINPFTPRQSELLQHMAQGENRVEAAQAMGISPNTARNLLYGYGSVTRGQKGILGVIEDITGTRPNGYRQWIEPLIGDVLIPVKKTPLILEKPIQSDALML